MTVDEKGLINRLPGAKENESSDEDDDDIPFTQRFGEKIESRGIVADEEKDVVGDLNEFDRVRD